MIKQQQESCQTNTDWLFYLMDERKQLIRDYEKLYYLLKHGATEQELMDAGEELAWTIEIIAESESHVPELSLIPLDTLISEGVTLEIGLTDAYNQHIEVMTLMAQISSVTRKKTDYGLIKKDHAAQDDLRAINSLLPSVFCELFSINGLPCMARRNAAGEVSFELLVPVLKEE